MKIQCVSRVFFFISYPHKCEFFSPRELHTSQDCFRSYDRIKSALLCGDNVRTENERIPLAPNCD